MNRSIRNLFASVILTTMVCAILVPVAAAVLDKSPRKQPELKGKNDKNTLWVLPVSVIAVEKPSEQPELPYDSNWNKYERRLWEKITKNDRKRDCGRLIFSGDCAESEKPIISSSFLVKILLDEKYLKHIPHYGARICGAMFTEAIDLTNAELKKPLILEHCRFAESVNFRGIKSKWSISLAKSTVNGSIDFTNATIEGCLNMNNSRFHKLLAENLKVKGELSIQNAIVGPEIRDRDSDPAINLIAANISGQLNLDHIKAFGNIQMQGITVSSQLSIKESEIRGKLHISGASIERQLNLKKSEINELRMPGVKIASRLVLEEVTVHGTANLNSVRVGGNIEMANGTYAQFSMITAETTGSLKMPNSKFSGMVEAYGLSVGDTLNMKGAIFKDELRLHRSHIGSILFFNSAEFFGDVSLKRVSINGDLETNGASFRRKLKTCGIQVKGELTISDGTFDDDVQIDLAQIGTIKYLGVKKLKRLNLTGTSVDKMIVKVKSISDIPESLKAQGFTYKLFMCDIGGDKNQDEQFFKAWLNKIKDYRPQPYMQCAKVLRECGKYRRANEVLYLGKEKERQDAWDQDEIIRWTGLSLLKWTIGYGIGYGYFLSLFWIFGLIILGTILCYSAKDLKTHETLTCEKAKGRWANYFFFSMDNLLPIISLRDKHKEIDPSGWQRYYFYGHKVAGWLLASFILAGLAGITQN
ncbi:MAG: hypothetical protein GY846_09980 [Deltaproteobacteria bacterium]|nr:hypothetical protein [Deltaproteobacteria bacterium]